MYKKSNTLNHRNHYWQTNLSSITNNINNIKNNNDTTQTQGFLKQPLISKTMKIAFILLLALIIHTEYVSCRRVTDDAREDEYFRDALERAYSKRGNSCDCSSTGHYRGRTGTYWFVGGCCPTSKMQCSHNDWIKCNGNYFIGQCCIKKE